MKMMKKICAILLAVLLMAGLSITAFAEGELTVVDTGSTVEVTLPGDPPTTTTAPGSDIESVFVGNAGNSPTLDTVVTVNGDEVWKPDSNSEATPSVTVTGDVSKSVSAESIFGSQNASEITVNGDVDGGVSAISNKGGEAKVTVNGDVDGVVEATSIEGDKAKVTVNGDVDGDVKASSEDGDKAEVTITGNADGFFYAYSEDGGESEISIGGNVTGDGLMSGVLAGAANGGSSTVTVAKDIDVKYIGIMAVADGTNSSATVIASNVEVTESTGYSVSLTAASGANVDVTIGTADSLTDGVVKGDIYLDNGVTAANASVTLWKFDGTVTGPGEPSALSYIVRVAEESQKAITAGGDVSIDENSGLTTVKLGETIEVQPMSGYRVVSASNNGTPISATGGVFSFKFEDPAGGIMLSAEYEELPAPPAPISPFPGTYASSNTFTLTFDLDGGVMPDGETELVMTLTGGTPIKLPEAPTKDGCSFAGWQTEVKGKTVVFDAGTRYIVGADKTFTALWE